MHPSSGIIFDIFHWQAYIRRAEALRRALESGRFEVPASLTYENVIVDYCKGHDIKANVKAFVEAILVAINNGKNDILLSFNHF